MFLGQIHVDISNSLNSASQSLDAWKSVTDSEILRNLKVGFSFIHSFIYLFIHLFIHPFNYLFIMINIHSYIYASIHSSILSFFHFIHIFIHLPCTVYLPQGRSGGLAWGRGALLARVSVQKTRIKESYRLCMVVELSMQYCGQIL